MAAKIGSIQAEVILRWNGEDYNVGTLGLDLESTEGGLSVAFEKSLAEGFRDAADKLAGKPDATPVKGWRGNQAVTLLVGEAEFDAYFEEKFDSEMKLG